MRACTHIWLALSVVIIACGGKEHPSGPPCLSWQQRPTFASPGSEAVDVLVVMDGASGSSDEQQAIASTLPSLIDELVNPADRNVDGRPDAPPVSDIHFGVITMDSGTEGFAVAGCGAPDGGDDGVLVTRDCLGGGAMYASYEEGDDPAALIDVLACLTRIGENGCGFRRPFDAALKALRDHSEGANEGFLRDNSMLVVLFVTGADDCSVRDEAPADELYDPDADLGPLALRCAVHEETHLRRTEDVAAALLALRADEPQRLVVAVTAGAPGAVPCRTADGLSQDFDCVLSDPAMQVEVDESGQHLAPSCEAPEGNTATPPRRLVTLLRTLDQSGAGTLLRSTCDSSYDEAMSTLAATIQGRLRRQCLSRPLPADDHGGAPCFIEEERPDSDACGPGRIDLGTKHGRRECLICQRGDGDERMVDAEGRDLRGCAGTTAAGDYWEWVVDSHCPETGTIEFRGRSMPVPGAVAFAGCFVSDC